MNEATNIPDAITTPKTKAGRVLLPWQEAWRRDTSDLKLWEKSRRIGATFTEANDVAMTRSLPSGHKGARHEDYWFSSADESAAYEFADYCRFWLKTIDKVTEIVEDQIEDPSTKRYGTAYTVNMPCGKRMTAMTSNPRRFRSKGGDVGLDEYGYHDEPTKMYKAAEPCTMWGGKLRILSTHNGEGSEFHKFCQMGDRHKRGVPKTGDIPFSLHKVTIVEAVEQGLVERINETKGTTFTRKSFLEIRRSRCLDDDQWNQEYMAIPSTDATAWLTYQLIESCELDGCETAPPGYWDYSNTKGGQRYIGNDIGESKDRTIIWTLERVGDVLVTREVLVMTDEDLSVKQAELLRRLRHPKVVRACVDGTGLGTQIGQEAVKTGKGESIKFTLPVKDELASPLRGYFEDRGVRVPGDADTREQLHAVRMTRTAGGPRYDAARTEDGHADKFWALALGCHAAKPAHCVARMEVLI